MVIFDELPWQFFTEKYTNGIKADNGVYAAAVAFHLPYLFQCYATYIMQKPQKERLQIQHAAG